MRRKRYRVSTKSIGGRRFEFVISTGSLDRDNDRIAPKGVDLSGFESNPVVLWAHDASVPPIGRARNTGVRGNALVSEVEFPEKGVYDLADQVHDLIAHGFLKAASVGFRPIAFERNDEGGFDFERVELLEWSVVPVPANAGAVVQLAGLERAVRRSRKELRSLENLSPKAMRYLVRHLVKQELAQVR